MSKCPICWCDIIGKQIITNCKHEFHSSCLWNTLKTNNTCPICRRILVVKYVFQYRWFHEQRFWLSIILDKLSAYEIYLRILTIEKVDGENLEIRLCENNNLILRDLINDKSFLECHPRFEIPNNFIFELLIIDVSRYIVPLEDRMCLRFQNDIYELLFPRKKIQNIEQRKLKIMIPYLNYNQEINQYEDDSMMLDALYIIDTGNVLLFQLEDPLEFEELKCRYICLTIGGQLKKMSLEFETSSNMLDIETNIGDELNLYAIRIDEKIFRLVKKSVFGWKIYFDKK